MSAARRVSARRVIIVLAAGVAGLCIGVVVHAVLVFGFPGLIFGEAALMHADGMPNFYDRTTWWDAVPLACAVLTALLALSLSRGHRQGV